MAFERNLALKSIAEKGPEKHIVKSNQIANTSGEERSFRFTCVFILTRSLPKLVAPELNHTRLGPTMSQACSPEHKVTQDLKLHDTKTGFHQPNQVLV
jgi:hypothetical protein